jgi:hypothetical protein
VKDLRGSSQESVKREAVRERVIAGIQK